MVQMVIEKGIYPNPLGEDYTEDDIFTGSKLSFFDKGDFIVTHVCPFRTQ
jgi:hypothetical protein